MFCSCFCIILLQSIHRPRLSLIRKMWTNQEKGPRVQVHPKPRLRYPSTRSCLPSKLQYPLSQYAQKNRSKILCGPTKHAAPTAAWARASARSSTPSLSLPRPPHAERLCSGSRGSRPQRWSEKLMFPKELRLACASDPLTSRQLRTARLIHQSPIWTFPGFVWWRRMHGGKKSHRLRWGKDKGVNKLC